MVSVEDSHANPARLQYSMYASFHSPSSRIWRERGRSMRTVRSNLFSNSDHPPPENPPTGSNFVSENLTDSVIDIRLGELASRTAKSVKSSFAEDDFLLETLNLSHSFSDYSICSSDISGELHRLATVTNAADGGNHHPSPDLEPEPCAGFLQRENFSTEIIESISPEDLQPTVKLCIDSLSSPSPAIKRSAAAKLRLLAKNRADNRVLIAESGAVASLVPLLKCTDPWTQEHAVTAILNLSLHPDNKCPIADSGGAIKSLIYVLKTGTETSKQNAATALMSLAMVEETRLTIGACGAIPPLVALLMNGTTRGKKDAMTTLYKLCSAQLNKERAVSAGAVAPLVGLVAEPGTGMSEKALVVLSSLSGVEAGRVAIVQEGGIPALVEAVEDTSSAKGKEFAVVTLLQLCAESVRNRGLLVAEGGIPPLVALSQTGTARAKHKAESLLRYLREPRHKEASSSSP